MKFESNMHYINLYNDEERDFYIQTDCPIDKFNIIRADYIESTGDNGYNYDDFFGVLRKEGYKVVVVKSEHRVYF